VTSSSQGAWRPSRSGFRDSWLPPRPKSVRTWKVPERQEAPAAAEDKPAAGNDRALLEHRPTHQSCRLKLSRLTGASPLLAIVAGLAAIGLAALVIRRLIG
jgi:hypothetical protein